MKNILSLRYVILSLVVLFATGCAVSFKKNVSTLPPITPEEVSVMSMNVENLFDTQNDPDRDDETFLPLSMKKDPVVRAACEKQDSNYRRSECLTTDYSEAALQTKLKNISTVVQDVDGHGPDNLMLIEVENENVLGMLNKSMDKAQYKTQVLIEGPDTRGIDVAFLSRWPMVGQPILHKIPWKPENEKDGEWMNKSRGILEVTVKAPNGDPITFLTGHFPSQSNPSYWRKQISQTLADLIISKGPKAMVIAGGDFNITHEEEEDEHYLRDILGKAGAVSHFVGCKDCPGTHYYRGSWSFLDVHVYSKALLAEGTGSYMLEPSTIDVIRYNPLHIKKGRLPKRWDNDKKEGVSDHWPLYARLKKRSEAKSPVQEPAPGITPKAKPKKKK